MTQARRWLGSARLKTFGQFATVKLSPDEHQLTFTCFTGTPGATRLAIEQHVNALKDIAIVIARKAQHTFCPEDIDRAAKIFT